MMSHSGRNSLEIYVHIYDPEGEREYGRKNYVLDLDFLIAAD